MLALVYTRTDDGTASLCACTDEWRLQILQDDYLTRTRAWQEERSRSAPPIDPDDPEFEDGSDRRVSAGRAASVGREMEAPVHAVHAARPLHDSDRPRAEDAELSAELREYLGADSNRLVEAHAEHTEPEREELEDLLAEERAHLAYLVEQSSQGVERVDPAAHQSRIVPPSPTYGSEDEEFERLLLDLDVGFDNMDLSGG